MTREPDDLDALARQIAAARPPFAHDARWMTGHLVPRWDALTDRDREAAVLDAPNYRRALHPLLGPSDQVDAVAGARLNRSPANMRQAMTGQAALLVGADSAQPKLVRLNRPSSGPSLGPRRAVALSRS